MRKARAIIVSDYVGGDGASSGGAGHAALDSYRALRDAGVDVRVIAGFGGTSGIDPGRTTLLGGRDLRAGGLADHARTIYNAQARTALTTALADEDPDTTLLIVHQWTRYLSPAALGVVNRFPTMIYMHDYFWACPNGLYYDFQAGRPCDRRPMGARCLAANCDRQGRTHKAARVLRQTARHAVTRSGPQRRLFLHLSDQARRTAAPLLPGERHAVVHNLLPVAAAVSSREAPLYDVGYFGRLESDKGVGALVDAVAAEGLRALFVGQGSLDAVVADQPGVELRAWQPRDSMAAAMRSCCIVVLPSLWHETWGLVVAEAMTAGVPVLVSCRAGSAELVRRFGGGATFDPALPGDLAAKLRQVTATPPAPVRFPADLHAFLSPERHAARIVDLAGTRFALDIRAVSDPSAAQGSPTVSAPPPPR